MSDYYEVLGVARDATEKDIRQAYRRLARQYHPDVNKNDAEAEETFKRINEAYGVLSDEETRKKYDRYGEDWKHADQIGQGGASPGGGVRWTVMDGDDVFSGFGGRGSIFEDFFHAGSARGRAWRPPPAEYHAEITLEEAFRGTSRTLRAQDGRNLEVKVPAGVDNGSRVHIAPDGPQGSDYYLCGIRGRTSEIPKGGQGPLRRRGPSGGGRGAGCGDPGADADRPGGPDRSCQHAQRTAGSGWLGWECRHCREGAGATCTSP